MIFNYLIRVLIIERNLRTFLKRKFYDLPLQKNMSFGKIIFFSESQIQKLNGIGRIFLGSLSG